MNNDTHTNENNTNEINTDEDEDEINTLPPPLLTFLYWGGCEYTHDGACNNLERGIGGCTKGCWRYFCPHCGLGTNRLYSNCPCTKHIQDKKKNMDKN